MKRDQWPMPRADDILDEINGSKVFNTIYLFQGYWQIKIGKMSKEKATFVCRYRTHQFEVMPFGLMNYGRYSIHLYYYFLSLCTLSSTIAGYGLKQVKDKKA